MIDLHGAVAVKGHQGAPEPTQTNTPVDGGQFLAFAS